MEPTERMIVLGKMTAATAPNETARAMSLAIGILTEARGFLTGENAGGRPVMKTKEPDTPYVSLPDSEKLRSLSRWLDEYDRKNNLVGFREVQDDLERIADCLDKCGIARA